MELKMVGSMALLAWDSAMGLSHHSLAWHKNEFQRQHDHADDLAHLSGAEPCCIRFGVPVACHYYLLPMTASTI